MPRKFSFLLLAMIIPPSTWSVELTDYTNPDSFYQRASVESRFNMKSGNQDQTSFQGSLKGDYEVNYSTSPLVLSTISKGFFNTNRGDKEGSPTEKSYNFTARGAADRYFDPNSLFLGYGSLELGYRKLVGRSADDPLIKLGGGVGYGRLINATPLAEVLRFVEELKEYGLLNTKELSDNTYLELAAVVAREEEYKSKYGLMDYKFYWINDLEKALQKAGVLKNNTLGTVGVIRVQDVLIERRITTIRKHGWLVKAGIGYIASNYDDTRSDPSLDASFDYAVPFTHKLQLTEFARYSTVLKGDVTHDLYNQLSVTYEVSDRIDWENIWDLNLLLPTKDNAEDSITNNFSSSFRYYISNFIDASVTLSLTKVNDDKPGNDDVDASLMFGITYRIR